MAVRFPIDLDVFFEGGGVVPLLQFFQKWCIYAAAYVWITYII